MLQIASATTTKLIGILASSSGIAGALAALSSQQGLVLPAISPHQIIAQNVAPELSERSTVSKYPLIYIYCSKMVNDLREKFRKFSGDVQMVVETRVSQDRLEQIETHLQAYVDAIAEVLDNSRGDWGDGVFYSGGYEVTFGSVKQGGRNFIQIAKVSFAVEISTD
jgi:hypothetical protein